MRSMPWKAGLAGAALVVTTVYSAAQMVPGQTPHGQMAPEQMTAMMQRMGQMMERCSNMMPGGPHKHGDAPAVPDKKD
jgi:hypothetical protein